MPSSAPPRSASNPSAPPPAPPLLEVRGICKAFPGVRALHQVDLQVARGEVVAVIGENGAGKSTLMKILAGVQPPDSGSIRFDGREVDIGSVSTALDLGISLIHQELNLADNLDVSANIFLGREAHRWGWMRRREMEQSAARYLAMVGLDVDPRTTVSELTIGKQQLVEIAKALSVDCRVLIMDEPTSSLSTGETERLFDVIDGLKRRGVSVIYISHRLAEVQRIADRVVVLRDGENAGELDRSSIDHDAMVRLMVGRDVSQFYARRPHSIGDVVLEVKDLVTPAWPQHRITFQVRAGEIVGLAGLVGAGRTELLQTLFAVDTKRGGTVRLDGKPLDERSPHHVIRRGVGLVPEDRKQHGLVIDMTVRQNLTLAGLSQFASRFGVLKPHQELDVARRMVDTLHIKTPSIEQTVRYLSGGNQQKVVLGKWLALGPKLLLLDEPTRGIDIGAKEEIYRLMEQLAEEGMAILFASSEMEEILGMSDRVLVMCEGRMTGELAREALSEEAVMRLATDRGEHVA